MSHSKTPRIVLIGETGQVGWELTRTLAPLGSVVALGRQTIDLAQLDSIRPAIRALNPTIIVNAAAYTNVEGAEAEESLAHRINAEAPGILAEEAKRHGAVMIHYSTDYVFDGTLARGYVESDATNPINAYGRSKLAGENAVHSSGAEVYTFRVSWVYGMRGRNFLRTMQRLRATQREVRVVDDQFGAPTWSRVIAEATAASLAQILKAKRDNHGPPACGVYHMTAPDFTTWHEFARTIMTSGTAANDSAPDVKAISTADYPTAAPRPRSSVLDSNKLATAFGLMLPEWREQFRQCLDGET